MKNLSILTLIVLVLSFHAGLAQVKKDTTKKSSDTTKRISTPLRELKFTQGSVPVFKTDAPAGKGGKAPKNVYYPPGDPGDPGDPTDPGDPPIDPVDPVDPVDPGNPPVSGATIEAGRTGASLDVSATGAAVYSLPLVLPPGLGNTVPQLAIVYNSQGGNGSLGLGWSLSGLSSISRIPATSFYDGFIGNIYYDSRDRFALDGQRLILKSGTYGADGAEYQTENYSNVRIFSRGQTGIGPDYFELIMPDGSKAYYGVGNDYKSVAVYAITYSESPLGARITYHYNKSDSSFTISRIEYGSLGTAAGINQIDFNYNTAIRVEQSFLGGAGFSNSRLLGSIAVIANGTGYRNYQLTYGTVTDLNYQRITSIQEWNGNQTKALSPISFSYGTTGNIIPSSTISNFGISGIDGNNSEIVAADFTGNGTMDLLWYNKADKTKFYAFYDMVPNGFSLQWGFPVNTGAFKQLIPATWLSHNDKLMPQQGLIVVKDNGPGGYKFEMLSAGITAPVYYQYDKVWDSAPFSPTFYAACDGVTYNGTPLHVEFISGDFNGDGLTDVIGINNSYALLNKYYGADPVTGDNFCDYLFGEVGSSAYFINMDRRITSGYVSNIGALPHPYHTGERLLTADYNGDGKTDILHVSNGTMYVYTINNAGALELLWQTTGAPLSSTDIPLIGDYNGDGKMDIMFSTGYNSQFITFLSTGTYFTKYNQNQPFDNTQPYWSPGAGSGYEVLRQYYLVANDVDGDGKTDIIRAETVSQNNANGGTINLNVYTNLGCTSANYAPIFASPYQMSQYTNLVHNPIPIVLNPNRKNFRPEFGFISDATISLFKFQKDFRNEVQISSITQDAVTHSITYNELTGEESTPDVPLYQISDDQNYPYVDLQTLPGLSVVSKLTRNYNGEQFNQVFGYGKAVSHIGGLGFMGFGELTRTNWHLNSSDNSRSYNISLFDPQLRGALVRSFVSKSTYINPSIKNLALSSPVPASGLSDGASINDYISRVDHVYSTQLLPNKVFVNVPVGSGTKDMLTGTFGTQVFEYDSYYNVTKTTGNINGTGTKTVEVTYDNNPAGNYIGRPLSLLTTLINGSESFSKEEQYTYSGYLLGQVKKRGNGTGWATENLSYDGFGNVTQKISTEPGGGQRTVSMAYDATGRFVESATDIEGLVTTSTNDISTGNVLTVTNSYGQTTTNEYDTWNRIVNTTNYLGKSKKTYYSLGILGGTSIAEIADDGSVSEVYYNVFGQKRGSRMTTVLGGDLAEVVEFDVYGRVYRQSEPAPLGSASQWNYSAYDEYGRIKQITSYTGKITNLSYNGLSVTVNDGYRSITTSKNAMGEIVSLQDPGGTITYSYFANGSMKTSSYNGISQSFEQDGWGNKTKLTDPSAGVSEYQYDGWGQLVRETTPKGVTEYIYDGGGKVIQQKLSGDDTSIQKDYTYDPTTKLVTAMALTNADGNNATYTYSYDTAKRPSSTVEDNIHARFVKTYTYDSFGRISTENFEAKNKANNISVSKTVEMAYQNGQLIQTTLQGTGQILWKIGMLDGKGNLAIATQGTALKNTMQFDTYNMPQQSILENVSATPVTLMSLGYSFDSQKRLLNSRSNSAFNWGESFTYDGQDRLTHYNDNAGNNGQEYDSPGRITYNSQIGNYTYNSANYQLAEIDLSNNTSANNYYQQQHALQQVSYNAFKSPVEIIEQGKERISFQYNASLGRSHMYYGDEQADKLLRRYRRHYSEDASMEITNDMATGKTSFVFYLDGDPYSAHAIWKEVHENGQNTQNLYYLHRDHVGSIVMITNDQGGVVEKRQFDAWGNIVKIQDGFGTDIASFQIIDRGFTGHEHLLGVGLIHMNGRLYDPRLHKFLSPDNFVQDPYNTQNYNRYSYAMNNPLMFTDPSGEFLHLILGAVIGGIINWIANGAEFSWKGLGYFAVGAIAGAVGAGVGAGVSSALAGGSFGAGAIGSSSALAVGTGFMSGAAVGAAGGAAGGFTGGFGNGLLGGESFGRALGSGLKGGAWGAVGGGVAGGLIGGIDAALDGRDFWTGAGVTSHELVLSGASNPQYSSTAEMRADYNTNIAGHDGISLSQVESRLNTTVSLADQNNLAGSPYSIRSDGLIAKAGSSETYGGVTSQRMSGGFFNRPVEGSSTIVMAPAVKSFNLNVRNMLFKHEFMHAWHMNGRLAGYELFTERATSAYSYAYVRAYGENWMTGFYRPALGVYPRSYSWQEFNKIIPVWLRSRQ